MTEAERETNQKSAAEIKSETADSQATEIPVETGSSGENEVAAPETVQAEVTRLTQNLAAKEDQYLRLAAEFDNFRKRTARDFGNLIETANQELIVELLGVLDDLRRAAASAEAAANHESLVAGVKLVQSRLEKILKDRGLEEIDCLGQKFDPNLHEALMTVAREDAAEDSIVEEIQKGYKLKGRVIRHSRVVVAKAKAAGEE